MSTLEIKNVDDIIALYKDAIGPEGIKRAMRNAINGTASELKRNTIGINNSKVWTSKASEVKKASQVVRVKRDGMEASVKITSKPDNPIKYTVSPTPAKHWKTIKQRPSHKVMLLLKKQMGEVKLPGNAISEPFIATMRAGNKTHTGIFVRVAVYGRIPIGKPYWKDTPYKKLPPAKLAKIVPVYTIPVSGQVRNDQVVNDVRSDLEEVFLEQFNKKMQDQLAKIMGK